MKFFKWIISLFSREIYDISDEELAYWENRLETDEKVDLFIHDQWT